MTMSEVLFKINFHCINISYLMDKYLYASASLFHQAPQKTSCVSNGDVRLVLSIHQVVHPFSFLARECNFIASFLMHVQAGPMFEHSKLWSSKNNPSLILLGSHRRLEWKRCYDVWFSSQEVRDTTLWMENIRPASLVKNRTSFCDVWQAQLAVSI